MNTPGKRKVKSVSQLMEEKRKKQALMLRVVTFVAGCICLVVALVAAALFFYQNHKITVSGMWYAADEEIVYSNGAEWTLSRSTEEKKTLLLLDEEVDLTGLVLYSEAANSLLLPNAYKLQYSSQEEEKTLRFFTTIEETDEGICIADGRRRKITVQSGVLFDGKDTYIFLEETTLSVDEETYTLPALTTVRAAYADALTIITYTGEEACILATPLSEATVPLSCGVTLYVFSDRVEYADGTTALMESP